MGLRAEACGRSAHNVPERLGEFAAVIVAELSGNLKYGAVGVGEHHGGSLHFQSACVCVQGTAVHELKALLNLRPGATEGGG